MRKSSFLFFSLLLCISVAQAQNVAINVSGNNAYTGAILDLSNNNTPQANGFLPPYVSLIDATILTTPITGGTGSQLSGLIVYNTNTSVTNGLSGPGLYYWNNTLATPAWIYLGNGTVGGSGTLNYLARWTPNGTTLGTGVTQDNGSVAVIQQTAAAFGTTSELTVAANTTETNAILGTTTVANAEAINGGNSQSTGTSVGVEGYIGGYTTPLFPAGVFGNAQTTGSYGVEGLNSSNSPSGGAGVFGADYFGIGVLGTNYSLTTYSGFYYSPRGAGGDFFGTAAGVIGSYVTGAQGGTGVLGIGYTNSTPASLDPNPLPIYDFGVAGAFGGSTSGAFSGAGVAGFSGNTTTLNYYAGVMGGSNNVDYGIIGFNTTAANIAIYGVNTAVLGTGTGIGIKGATSQSAGYGMYGTNNATAGVAVYGINNALAGTSTGIGVEGSTGQSSGYGVWGNNTGFSGSPIGVYGTANITGTMGIGVEGNSTIASGTGVEGITNTTGIGGYGVKGLNATSLGGGFQYAIYGLSTATAGNGFGVFGSATGAASINYGGYFTATGAAANYGLVVPAGGGFAGIATITPQRALEIGGTANTVRIDGIVTGNSFNSAVTTTASNLMYTNNSTGDIYALPTVNNATLVTSATGIPSWSTTAASVAWQILGNGNSVDGTNFIGTTNTVPINFQINGNKAGRIDGLNFNTFLGYQSGNSTTAATTGQNNVGIGNTALKANTTASFNTAVGSGALASNNAADNTAIGYNALTGNTGTPNTAVGYLALKANTSGTNNVALGDNTLIIGTTASFNNAIGSGALKNNTGSSNVADGYQALQNNNTGSNNVGIGYQALSNNTNGGNNTALGSGAGVASGGLTNATAIGNGATVSISNAVVLGNLTVDVGINTTAPICALDIGGTGYLHVSGNAGPPVPSQGAYLNWNGLTGGTGETDFINEQGGGPGGFAFFNTTNAGGWAGRSLLMTISGAGNIGIGAAPTGDKLTVAGNTVPSIDNAYTCGKAGQRWSAIWSANGAIQTSDRRYKENIQNMTYGLKEVLQLRPVTYTWIANPEQGLKVGFIAQEVQSVIKEVVSMGDDKQHSLGLNYGELVPVLVNAIKEQQQIIVKQQTASDTQQAAIDELKKEVETLKQQMAGLSKNSAQSVPGIK